MKENDKLVNDLVLDLSEYIKNKLELLKADSLSNPEEVARWEKYYSKAKTLQARTTADK